MSFTHLHVHTKFSNLDGLCKPKELAAAVKEMGQTACAITDHGYCHGLVEFYNACKEVGVKPILGVELYTAENIFETNSGEKRGHVVFLAKNQTGYKNLLAMASVAATKGFYYKPRVDLDTMAKYSEGIICLSACLQGDVPRLLVNDKVEEAYAKAKEYKAIFGDDYYIELQYHGLPEQKKILPMLIKLAKDLDIQMVATNDVHYIKRSDAEAQRCLMCMSMKTTVDDETALGYGNPDQWYLKSEEEMEAIFGKIAPEAIANTAKIAEMCNVEIEQGNYNLPKFPLPDGYSTTEDYFDAMCHKGFQWRYGENPADIYKDQMSYETGIIKKMGFEDYFLIVQDTICFAKKHNIPIGPGRGSSAASMVAYSMGITDLEPKRYDLVFERFLNPERITMPDVDIDISPAGRELTIEHLEEKYGRQCIARICTANEWGAKGSIREVGKAMNMDPALCNKINKLIPESSGLTMEQLLKTSPALEKIYNSEAMAKKLIDMCIAISGTVRHYGTHAAGVIVSSDEVFNHAPLMLDKNKQVVIQYDMASAEAVGLLKIDLLGLKTLDVLENAEESVNVYQKENGKRKMKLSALKMADKSVYAMLSRGETTGVFQLESAGMRDILRRLQPTCIDDLIAVIALYRPGPMDSIPRFIENKHNPEKITYLHPSLEPILKSTYGCIVFQEQVMRIVRDLAGYSFGRSDLVRRAMSKKKHDVMEKEKDVFIHGCTDENGNIVVDGCVRRGIPEEIGEKLWAEMSDFASYAFNKAHAACYAVLAYQTAFLRCHFYKQFMAAMMTNEIDGTKEKMLSFLADCEDSGIPILPPDINKSEMGFSVEDEGIRFGLSAIKSTQTGILSCILVDRSLNGPYSSMHNMMERNAVAKPTLEALIKSGSMDTFDSRENMLAVMPAMLKAASKARSAYNKEMVAQESMFFGDADAGIGDFHFPEVPVPENVPVISELEKLKMEQEVTGLFISGHPINAYRDELSRKADHKAADIVEGENNDGQQVRIGGIVTLVKKITTKKKQAMAFINMEDQTGKVEVTLFPSVFAAYSDIAEGDAILVYGKVEASDYGKKIVADGISKLQEPNA